MSTNFLDLGNILRMVYEPASESLRVNAVIAPPSGTEVIIHHEDDSIRLGDGTGFITTTVSGSKRAIDVAIVSEAAVAATPGILNVAAPVASFEYNINIPIGTKKIQLKSRLGAKMQFSFDIGQSNVTFITIQPGNSYPIDTINTTAMLTIYAQSTKNGDTFEVLTWS